MSYVALRYAFCLLSWVTFWLAAEATSFAQEDTPAAEKESTQGWQGEYPELPIPKMSVEEFEQQWQIDAKFDQVPLGEVLQQLIASFPGLRAEVAPHHALEQKISLDLKKVSHLEAIERACRQAGYHPSYYRYDPDNPSMTNWLNRVNNKPLEKRTDFDRQVLNHIDKNLDATIALSPGKYPVVDGLAHEYPSVTFAGPLRVQLTDVLQNVPNATGKVSVSFLRLPLPGKVVRHDGKDFYELPWELVTLRGNPGRSVKESSRTSGWSPTKSILLSESRNLLLKGLLQNANELEELTGEFTLLLPQAWKPIWIENPTVGKSIREGDYEVQIIELSTERLGFYIRCKKPPTPPFHDFCRQYRVFAFDAQGELISPDDAIYQGFFSGFGNFIPLHGKPALVAIVPITEVQEIKYQHRFTHIPLSEHEKQPSAVEPLEYGEHKEPISVEVLGFTDDSRNKVRLKITNHSNKDLWEVMINVGVKGPDGDLNQVNSILDTGHFYMSSLDNKLNYKALVPAHGSYVSERDLQHVPPEKAKLAGKAYSAEFSDGTKWPAKPKYRTYGDPLKN
ncbi:hypothetical protein DTL42_18520 [Bremerella cremea]|uniref:Uncharacterized protein n=1 Tax=Bremerella cremea TaxID=1031537 RepID=A0A368KMS2_9BACT|nr:hypothetical protein [Bremerella cremea]RCS43979.1 hypothetical protein DTL42_18520 [Bremerella cremea]